MRIHVGSKNQSKVDAVTEMVKEYSLFAGAEVVAVDVPVETFGHPKSLAETVAGAEDRARAAFAGADYSVGIEGGLMAVPRSKTGYMEVTACVIYDGQNFHLGLSSAYEWPKKVNELILSGRDGSQAMREAGLTDHPKIGAAEGAIWLLTKERLGRREFIKQGLMMALLHLENPEHY